MPIFLAIDAGVTKTEFALANEVHEVARARVGTIKLLRVGPEEASHNLTSGLVTKFYVALFALSTSTSPPRSSTALSRTGSSRRWPN